MDPIYFSLYPNLRRLNDDLRRAWATRICPTGISDFVSGSFRIRHEDDACLLHRACETLGNEEIVSFFFSKYNNHLRRKGVPVRKLIEAYRSKLTHIYVAADLPWSVYILKTRDGSFGKIGVSQNPLKRGSNVAVLGRDAALKFCHRQSVVIYGFTDKAAAFAAETALKKSTLRAQCAPPGSVPRGHTEWRRLSGEFDQAMDQWHQGLIGLKCSTFEEFAKLHPNSSVFDLLVESRTDATLLASQERPLPL